ncbi:YcjF family protein [Aurantimonas sp. HBX-1]|uniref:YcjF family protein n=1 Tax=Aurantimonas sp. HBX-1 TaxID=2906072 RepID=UPI001F244E71|nr:TIGR01620 family protein [Aurantimonas sp. HBX-1]UIJ73508.1 YcjF family protein [Aurantimonas sp. HBX-1]
MSNDDVSRPGRRPGAYRLDEAGLARTPAPQEPVAPARAPRAIEDLTRVALEPDDAIERQALDALEVVPASRRRRGFSFGKLFIGALGVLVSLGVALAIDALIRDLFARYDCLGWLAVAVTVLLVIGAVGVAAREAIGLMRLSAVDRERQEGLAAYEANAADDARNVVRSLSTLLSGRPETAHGRARLAALEDEVIDGADLIALAERELLGPLDAAARTLVLASSKRVSVVTAVSPKALVDVAYVLFETVKLIRRMSELYGARPGTLGLIRLTRDVLAHLAVTGSIAIGDGVMQQLLGHGVAAKLSARMGEGVVNGLLTARVGLAAMDLCRPLPFLRMRRPRIGDVLSELVTIGGGAASRRQASGANPNEL